MLTKKRFDNKGSLPKILRNKILHKLVLVNHTNTFLSSNDTLFVYKLSKRHEHIY